MFDLNVLILSQLIDGVIFLQKKWAAILLIV